MISQRYSSENCKETHFAACIVETTARFRRESLALGAIASRDEPV
jgi:hypothetical protein